MPKSQKFHSIGWWKRTLDSKLGKWLRESYSECARCHKIIYLQVSHILPKGRYQGLRYDPVNVLPMCAYCHLWWHAGPLDSNDWFKKNFPQRDTYLEEAKRVFIKTDQEFYKRVYRSLKKRKIRSLLTLDKHFL